MDINLIDQQIIDSFFKYYKKDVKAIQFHEFKILKEKISQNLQKIIDLPDAKELFLKEFSDYKFSFFHVVAKFGKAEELKRVIDVIGIDNLNVYDVNKYTALHHSSISGRIENVKILIGYGANINAKSSDETRNWLPIHYASKFGYKEIVEEFIEAGIDKEITTSFGLTPLHVATEFGSFEVAKYLTSIKCDLNAETIPENQRLTPLHFASIGDFYDIVVLLITSGADRNKRNGAGDNSLIMATKRNHMKICQYFAVCGLEDLDLSYEIAKEKNFRELVIILKDYIDVKNKLFNEFELTRISRELVDFVSKIKPHSLDSLYFKLFDSVEVSGYFLCSIKKEFGFFKKRTLTLQKFADECGLSILAENLKKLDQVVTHCELLRRY
jgi:hypothetical protein